MLNKTGLFVLVLLLTTGSAVCQQNSFAYRRKLSPATAEGWYTLVLPTPVFANVAPGYSDLRIYTYTAADTTEVPYILKVREDLSSTKDVQLRKLNESRKNGDLYATFELPKDETVNYLSLAFSEPDFDATAALEGSTDQQNWFAILSPQRIVSVKNDRVDFEATTLAFSETNYRYLRVTVKSKTKLNLTAASFRQEQHTAGTFRTIPNRMATEQDKANKRTLVTLTADQYQPISKISLSIANDGDYYRPFIIEALSDSAKTEKGWLYYYNTVAQGFLTSVRANDFEFAAVSTRKLRISIENADNPPLAIQLAAVYGPQVEMITKLKPGSDYYLVYGNKNAYAPSYDLVHFEKQIPAERTALEAGPEKFIGQAEKHGSPLIENKGWLWGVMALVIGVLGFFTLRMMKAKG